MGQEKSAILEGLSRPQKTFDWIGFTTFGTFGRVWLYRFS